MQMNPIIAQELCRAREQEIRRGLAHRVALAAPRRSPIRPSRLVQATLALFR